MRAIIHCCAQGAVPVWRGVLALQHSFSVHNFENPWGIAVLPDRAALVISDPDEDSVVVVAHYSAGAAAAAASSAVIAEEGGEPGQVSAPMGLCLEGDRHVLVADAGNHCVQRLSLDGGSRAGGVRLGSGVLRSPWHVAVHNGELYVADGHAHCIVVLSRGDGAHVRSLGGEGRGDGQFLRPTSVALTPAHGDVVVADCHNHRVQVLRADGTHVRTLLAGQLHFPWGVAVDGAENVVVADTHNNRVLVASLSDGSVLAVYGGAGAGAGAGQFHYPRCVALLADGSVAVTDSKNARVQIV